MTLTANSDAGDDLIIVWPDGSNSYIGTYNITSAAAIPLTGDSTTMVELVGVIASTSGVMTAANFEFVA